MSRLGLILISIAFGSSVCRCGEVYIERDASSKPIALVHNGPSAELEKFFNANDHKLLQTIETVRLLQHRVDATEIKCLSVLKSLRSLELGDHPDEVNISPDALSAIASLPTIEHLSIYGRGEVNNFDWLDSLPKLRSVTLSSDNLYSKGVLQRIGKLHCLVSLSVRCSFPIADFQWLRKLTQLEQIDLYAERVNIVDFSAFGDLSKLKNLSISGYKFSNRDLVMLAKHVGQRLEFLSVNVNGDCTIETLSDFSNLKKLVVQHASPTDLSQRVVDATLVFSLGSPRRE